MIYIYLTQLHEWISLLQQLVVFRSKYLFFMHTFFYDAIRYKTHRTEYTQVNAIHQYEL